MSSEPLVSNELVARRMFLHVKDAKSCEEWLSTHLRQKVENHRVRERLKVKRPGVTSTGVVLGPIQLVDVLRTPTTSMDHTPSNVTGLGLNSKKTCLRDLVPTQLLHGVKTLDVETQVFEKSFGCGSKHISPNQHRLTSLIVLSVHFWWSTQVALGLQSYLLRRYDWTLLAPTPVPPSKRRCDWSPRGSNLVTNGVSALCSDAVCCYGL